MGEKISQGRLNAERNAARAEKRFDLLPSTAATIYAGMIAHNGYGNSFDDASTIEDAILHAKALLEAIYPVLDETLS